MKGIHRTSKLKIIKHPKTAKNEEAKNFNFQALENVRDSNPEPARESSVEAPLSVNSREQVKQITHMAIKSARGHTEDRSAIKSLVIDKKAIPSLESTLKSEFKPNQLKSDKK